MSKRDVLARLLRYLLDDKKGFAIAAALLLVAAVADVSGPWLIRIFLDDYLAKSYFPPMVLWGLAIGYISATVLSAALHYSYGLRFSRIAIGIVQTIRKKVYASIINQPLSAFDYVPAGKLVSRVTNDTESLKELYVQVVASFLNSVALITAMLIAMYLLSPTLTLVVAILLPSVVFVMYYYQHRSTPAYRDSRDLLTDINSVMSESIQGMSLIQLMGQEQRFSERFASLTDQHLTTEVKIVKVNGIFLRPLIDLMSGIALISLTAIFGWQGSEVIGVGVLYAFISYLGRVTEPLIELMQRLSLLQQAIMAGERLFELMDAKPNQYGSDDAPIENGDIEISNLTFSYDGKTPVLTDINASVKEGGFLALVGHTGSGKSTLASLMMGFYPLQAGELKLGGRAISSLTQNAMRTGIAMVQQDPHVLSATFRENVTLGRKISDDDIWQALEQVDLADYVQHLPTKLDTPIGTGDVTLSAGQKQLLALARVLVERPRILILDEATANIDSGTEERVQRALSSLRHTMTIVVIAHRLSTIADADKILVLHRGHVEEQGSHQQLLANKGRYWQMYQLQQTKAHLVELEQIASGEAESAE
ncbi:multidrug ABC transporter permease/ATP-binding protein [Enterovibrio norvegicus FF-162]|uniref:ABC transporter transmembrane domain-containing protein n=2 Tax=Enterovibrio norvegicus TaxID=188144 RepID=UPI000317D2E9|nr:ABC transporter transmembrane domain-containing protein [Enterovibrio norvegicus]OEE90287.1 multidrug ABC transporter permease/ATP-binding protein [Enterovibrio norvegicus FF-162]